jgi:cytidylate kinase
MSGAASVPLAVCAIYFPNAPLKVLFCFLAAFSVVWACYRVWRDSVRTLLTSIETRDAEIEKLNHKLNHRDYDEEHRRLAELKVNALTEAAKTWCILSCIKA